MTKAKTESPAKVRQSGNFGILQQIDAKFQYNSQFLNFTAERSGLPAVYRFVRTGRSAGKCRQPGYKTSFDLFV